MKKMSVQEKSKALESFTNELLTKLFSSSGEETTLVESELAEIKALAVQAKKIS